MISAHLRDPRRNKVITASNAWSAINDRKKLWREMTFRSPPFQGNVMTDWGNLNEPKAISEFEKKLDTIVESGDKFEVHDTLPFGATADFKLDGYVGECKCPYTQVIYPKIPERYFYQVQIQMLVNKSEGCHFVVWTPHELHHEVVKFDQGFIDWYLPYAKEFMSFLESDTEPTRWKKKPIYKLEE